MTLSYTIVHFWCDGHSTSTKFLWWGTRVGPIVAFVVCGLMLELRTYPNSMNTQIHSCGIRFNGPFLFGPTPPSSPSLSLSVSFVSEFERVHGSAWEPELWRESKGDVSRIVYVCILFSFLEIMSSINTSYVVVIWC